MDVGRLCRTRVSFQRPPIRSNLHSTRPHSPEKLGTTLIDTCFKEVYICASYDCFENLWQFLSHGGELSSAVAAGRKVVCPVGVHTVTEVQCKSRESSVCQSHEVSEDMAGRVKWEIGRGGFYRRPSVSE